MNKTNLLYRFLTGGLGVAIILSSCTNLETNEVDSFVPGSDGAGLNAEALLTAIYEDNIGALTDQQNVYALFEHTSDEMLPPTRGVDWGDNGVWRTLHQHTWDPTHQHVINAWNQLNERTFKCTQILSASPSAEQAAQAKFLRAFFMYQVMDLYGKVPFREVNEGVDTDPRVLTRSEAFSFIVKDLEEALPVLANTGPKADNHIPTKAAANTLLARLYLNKAVYLAEDPAGPYTFDDNDMAKVIEYCEAVEAAGYSLEDEYFTNFTGNATKEIIFTSKAGSPQNRYFMTLHYNQNPSGWNGFTTLADFYAKFEDGDARKGNYPAPNGTEFSGIGRGFLIGQQYNDNGEPIIDSRTQKPLVFTPDVPLSGASTEKGIRVIKYHPKDKGQYVFLRYADVLLMNAEARMRSGDNAGALDLVNQLRAKRGASNLETISEASMLDERGRELYWEGIRRTDQIRFGTFSATWSEKTNVEPFRVLFPIPQQAIDSNPNLSQNTGYPGAE